ncbi:hypothetical protein L596_018683 [Steinernema carpocapsae]|uniref:Uncharacterized protein n=1 Tax=Steinernema carpocapsae TaxID=34508 RepID=A0A4U5N5U7_STECR|nr:hypothetical protein L596_018683 [Steinernema carpocapsae]
MSELCGSFVAMLITPMLFSMIALGSSVLILWQVIKSEQARMDECETNGFKLFDEMFQAMTPKGIVDKIASGEKEMAAASGNVKGDF